MQLGYHRSDPGREELLSEGESGCRGAGLRLAGPLPAETTIRNFRPLLARHGLGAGLGEVLHAPRADRGPSLRRGTLGDASLSDAPRATQNRPGGRDPELRRTKKGSPGSCGMQAPSGVDADAGLTPTLRTTGAGTVVPVLRPGGEEEVHGDAGYLGAGRREEHRDPEGDWRTARQPGQRRRLA